MRSLFGIGLRYVRVRPGRTALNVVSVVLGVALSFAVTVATASIVDTLDRASGVDDLVGDVVASPLGGRGRPLDAATATRVDALDGVVATSVLADGSLDVDLAEGTDVDSWLERHEGDGVRLATAEETRTAALGGLADVAATMPTATLLGLIVGGYLIHLTFATSVLERRRVFGTLRALGATRRDVVRIVLWEAIVLGVVGAALGVMLGLVLATGVAESLAAIAGRAADRRVVPVTGVVLALALGVLTPAAAAFGPAVRAARVDPVEALRGTVPAVGRPSRSWVAGAVMLALVGASVALAPVSDLAGELGRSAGAPLLLVGAMLLVPRAMPVVAAVLRPVVHRVAPGVGEIAMHHVSRERNRSAYTSGIMMVVIAMVLTFGALVATWRPLVVDQVDRQFGADLVVEGDGADLDAVATVVERSDLAADVARVRQGDGQLLAPASRVVPLTAVDVADYLDVTGFAWAAGTTDADVVRATAGGAGAVLPELLRVDLGVETGDVVALATTSGTPLELEVVGSYLTFGAGDAMSLVVDEEHAAGLGLSRVTSLALDARGGDVERLASMLAARPESLDLRSTADERAQVLDRVDGVLAMVLMVAMVAMVVGVLAIASTMTASVLARTREIGIVRAVGARLGDVRTMIVVEAAILAASATLLGAVLGGFMSWVMLTGIGQDFANPVPRTYPWSWLGLATLLGAAAAITASVVPARHAARVVPRVALAVE